MDASCSTRFARRLRVFVTGISGLLGSNFAFAVRDKFELTGAYSQHAFLCDGCNSLQIDLRDSVQVIDALNLARPDWIVHFAAATDVNRCQDDPSYAKELNVSATETLASWASKNNARLLLMSTDSVFDGATGGYVEYDQPNPINTYAASKVDAENIVRKINGHHLIIRANIYGWNTQPKLSLAEWVLSRLESGLRVPGFVDAVFAPLLVNTLSEILTRMIVANAAGTYHLGATDHVSKFEFARLVSTAFGMSTDLIDKAHMIGALKAPRPLNTWLNPAKYLNEFGNDLPSISEDLKRFKNLRDNGFVEKLKQQNFIQNERQ
ncbi:MAG: SDR family oxidoreductase [Nibricoccus sp.]